MTLPRKKILDTAIACYGIEHQRTKCIEELSELTKELCKDAISDGDKHRIADEIADVLITVEQMIRHYGIEQIVNSRITFKLDRLAKKLNMTNEEE